MSLPPQAHPSVPLAGDLPNYIYRV